MNCVSTAALAPQLWRHRLMTECRDDAIDRSLVEGWCGR
jgi:hypothetical protein